jgi:error-prone DNA polymerase
MSHARSAQEMERIGQHFMEKAQAAGVDKDVAATIFSYIQGYASYGFCEAHAAAFASTAYKTAYLVRHFPAEYFAAILNQYPMGYYPVHVICAEARRRGIEILPLDVNRSEWGCTVEDGKIRIGFCLLKGFRQSVAEAICQSRSDAGPFTSVLDCLERIPELDRLSAERMIRVGAFDALADGKRKTMLWYLPEWIVRRNEPTQPLFAGEGEQTLGTGVEFVEEFSLAAKLADEYNLLGLGVSGHWMTLFRPWAREMGFHTAADIENCPDGMVVYTAGVLIRPHRPPTRSGKTVVFFTVEDETGFIDATMFEDVYHESGAVLFTPYGRLIGVEGTVQRRDGDARPQLVVRRVWSLMQ